MSSHAEVHYPVPSFSPSTPLNCGPNALRMIIAFFDEDPGIKKMEQLTHIQGDKALATIQIATAAATYGFHTTFYSTHVLFDEKNMQHEFYKQYSYLDVESSKKLVQEAKDAGVIVHEKHLTLEEVLKHVSQNSIPIVLVDWNIISGSPEKGFQGHFVPVVGYTDTDVIIHNNSATQHVPHMHVRKELFDNARTASGTDEDIVIIERKKNEVKR